jgi:hypothetical protein
VLRETLVSGRCTYLITADAGGLRVLRDGEQRAATTVPVPEVGELATDLEGQPAAQGLAVSLHTELELTISFF